MADIDLTTLDGPELRGLLDSTRQRGQAAQSYRILQEMAARRAREEGAPSPLPGRRRPSAVIAVDLGDPLDRPEEPLTLAQPQAQPAVEDDFDVELRFTAADRPAPKAKKRRAPERDPRTGRPRRRRWSTVVFGGGIGLGLLMGWGVAQEALAPPAPPAAVFPAAPMLRPDQAPAPPPPPVEQVVVTAAPPPPEAVPTAADAAEAATPASTAAPASDAAVAELAPPAEPVTAPEPEPAAKACPGATTPADRAICETPKLQRLQRDLRQAYAEALDAHADRALLRQHQLAWRDARNDVGDPERLARLYEARIRKLNAAAAEARRER